MMLAVYLGLASRLLGRLEGAEVESEAFSVSDSSRDFGAWELEWSARGGARPPALVKRKHALSMQVEHNMKLTEAVPTTSIHVWLTIWSISTTSLRLRVICYLLSTLCALCVQSVGTAHDPWNIQMSLALDGPQSTMATLCLSTHNVGVLDRYFMVFEYVDKDQDWILMVTNGQNAVCTIYGGAVCNDRAFAIYASCWPGWPFYRITPHCSYSCKQVGRILWWLRFHSSQVCCIENNISARCSAFCLLKPVDSNQIEILHTPHSVISPWLILPCKCSPLTVHRLS